ncbi:hypothetical protein [Flavobacterium pallidum]|uniref:DUF3347 domain-containing protein n=1 Tax=Flavobacterium pallidum TaxID=2172098 RepID=A0A2S1SDR4_9FLAO|nr:hypothetical protein [Flavobacterium pallidum]AWI24537.1 hypothetical protein HYN49_00755 [Flavobacterium pallidum]
MKNLIIAFSLFFAVGASAQAKKQLTPAKATPKAAVVAAPKLTNLEKAQKNVADLNAFIPLSAEKQATFTELFTTKYKMLEGAGDSADRKQIISYQIARKIEASIDAESFEKIKSNETLFQKLTN